MAGVKGKGAKLHIHNGTALTKISDLLSVTPPSQTRDTIDTTHHESSGDYREFIASLMDAGEATALIHYEPGSANDTLLLANLASGAVRAFAIDVNKATGQQRLSGSAIMTAYAPADVVIDDKMTATITLKVSGPLVSAVAPAV